jgi:hypothetical protein
MRANLKIPGVKPTWTVTFPVFGGQAGREFPDEWDAYKFAAINRPSSVSISANGLPSQLVAEFPLEPEWWA